MLRLFIKMCFSNVGREFCHLTQTNEAPVYGAENGQNLPSATSNGALLVIDHLILFLVFV